MAESSLTRYAWLSIAAAVITIALKSGAYLITGSVGFLSDAVESIVNLLGGLMALWMLTLASKPADLKHTYGHSKAEYFASGTEGFLILLAAVSIAFAAIQRLLQPQALEKVGWGLAVSISASLVNFLVARVLLKAGRKYNSITLEADSAHLMTDVWTSLGVILAVFVVSISHWQTIDPIIALIVAANIVYTGVHLVNRSISGLMDAALPPSEQKEIEGILDNYRKNGIEFHALLTRQSAARKFISVHILVPGDMNVHDGHHIAEEFEHEILDLFNNAVVITHLEPIEDEISSDDILLDRERIERKLLLDSENPPSVRGKKRKK